MAAWNLTRQGIDVLLLDAGTKFDRGTYWTHVRPWEARERRARGEAPPDFFLDTKEQPYAAPDGQHFDLYRVWGHGGKTNVWGRVSLRLSRPRLQGPGEGRLGDPVADLLRRHRAVLRPGRAADRRLRRHRRFRFAAGQQASCSRRRRRAAPSACCRRRPRAIGIDIVAGRRANMTRPTRGFPACHYCGNCGAGCDTASFFNSADHLLPFALKTGQARDPLERRRGAHPGRRQGPRQGRPVLRSHRPAPSGRCWARSSWSGASCVDSTRILLNSKSTAYPERHRQRLRRDRPLPVRADPLPRPRLPAAAGRHGDAQRSRHRRRARLHAALQPSRRATSRDYLRGFGMQFWNTGASDTGAHGGSERIPGFGVALKNEIKRRHPAWFEIHPYGEVLPYAAQPHHRRTTPARTATACRC